MGTALTEAHLRELSRLTRNLSLCFDADAAGQEATIRGMELAIGQGFKIRIVTLPTGTDPADDPTDFESKLAAAEAYLSYRVRCRDRPAAAGPPARRSSASARSWRRFPSRRTARMPSALRPTGSGFPPSCRRASPRPRAPVAAR